MFSGLIGGPKVSVDTRDWHPAIDIALEHFESKNWSDLSLLVSRQNANSAFRLIQALGARTSLDSSLGTYPHTPTMLTLMGGVGVCWAWRHRGFGAADDVEDERWPRFFDSLKTSHELLRGALDFRPTNAVALGFLGRLLTGLGEIEDLQTVERKFEACRDRPIEACIMFLQSHSPKWGGDISKMFSYARRQAEDENLHPARYALVARAHIERWLYEGWMQEDQAVAQAGRRYMSSRDVAEDVNALNLKFNQTMAADKEAQSDEAALMTAHNNFGFAFYLIGDRHTAAQHVDALGAHPGVWPWVYSLGDPPAEQWPSLRKSLGLSKYIREKNS